MREPELRILLPPEVANRIRENLRRAGRREIGGVLMGEHVEENTFRVVDITVQRRGGAVASFLRGVAFHLLALSRFFRQTGHRYSQFNYLGEWHSHPSYLPHPSPKDRAAMLNLVTDPGVGANFLILIIVRLGTDNAVDGTATAFLPTGMAFRAGFEVEAA